MNKIKTTPFHINDHPELEVQKAWGKEIIFANNPLYCGKLLCFNKGSKFSMHFHIIKDETWWVQSGEFIYRWIDTDSAQIMEERLLPGHIVRQHPGQPHQLEAISDSIIFEVSTEHFDWDSYRVLPGDSQK